MVNLSKKITKKKFKKLIEDGELIAPKTQIAEHFGISKSTLYRWMRKNGFEDLIDVKRGKKSTRKIKTVTDDYGNTKKVIQFKPRSMRFYDYVEGEEI